MISYKNTVSFADIETTAFSEVFDKERIEQLEFRLGCVITYNDKHIEIERKDFNDLDKFCVHLNKLNIVYFHNFSFDFKFIQERLLIMNTLFKLISTPSSTLCAKFYLNYGNRNRKTVEIRDSLAFLKTSIKKLGLIVNLPKIEIVDNDFVNINYCYRDCEIIAHSFFHMIKFINDQYKIYDFTLEILKMPLTVASLSKAIFQKIYPKAFYQHHIKLDEALRKFYYGGRTEVFDFNLLKDGYYVDVVSLYPSIACKYKLPNTICHIWNIVKQDYDFHLNNPNTFGFVCTITENQEIPLFPSRKNDKVVYMNGKKEIFMTMYEYNELKELGLIGKEIIIENISMITTTTDTITFKDYFIPLVEKKKTTIFESERYFCKILMNSLTGKFGQKPERKEITYYNVLDIESNKDFYFDIDIDASYTEVNKIQYYQTSNLLVIISITNLARFTLWKQIRQVVKGKEKVYYCDTDSIVVDKQGLSLFNISDNLGCWNIEKKFKRFQAIDSKEYIYTEGQDTIIKFKGLITKHFTESDFYIHYAKGSITRIIPKNRYCDIRKIPHSSVVFLRKNKRQFYFKREIQKDLTTIALNSDTIDILTIKDHNKDLIFTRIINPNLISIEV